MTKTKNNSERMKKENPMFNINIKNKRLETIKTKGNWGKFNEGRKRPDLTKSNLENNPMKNIEIKNKASKNSIKTRKRLYSEGKLKVWNDGLSKEEFLKHMPDNFVEKIKNGNRSLNARKKNSKTNKELWEDKSFREKRLKSVLKGKSHPLYGKKISSAQKLKRDKTMRKNGRYKEFSERMKNGGAVKAMSGNQRPSKPELILLKIIKENNLPFNYVGDGKICIGGFNPDFINEDKKIIIELNGEYWHNLPENIEKDARKYEEYKKQGYKFIIISDSELKNKYEIIDKINNLLRI